MRTAFTQAERSESYNVTTPPPPSRNSDPYNCEPPPLRRQTSTRPPYNA